MVRLKLTHCGASMAVALPDDCTVGDIITMAIGQFKLGTSSQVQLYAGYPPKLVEADTASQAQSAGIKAGSVVDVRTSNASTAAAAAAAAAALTTSRSSSSSSSVDVSASSSAAPCVSAAASFLPAAAPTTWSCRACTVINPLALDACEMCGTARPPVTSLPPPPPKMARHVVPADNSCLFTSLGYLTDAGRGMGLASAMRRQVAAWIRAHPLDFDEATLGRPPTAYYAYIQLPQTWGGGVDMAAASALLGLEVAAVSIQSGVMSRFGEDKAYTKRIYVLYDGIHIDAIHRTDGSGVPQTVFDVSDADAEAGALAVAQEARRARQFTDLGGCSLMCGVCGVGLTGEKQAREHAKATAHVNFQEAVDPLKVRPQ